LLDHDRDSSKPEKVSLDVAHSVYERETEGEPLESKVRRGYVMSLATRFLCQLFLWAALLLGGGALIGHYTGWTVKAYETDPYRCALLAICGVLVLEFVVACWFSQHETRTQRMERESQEAWVRDTLAKLSAGKEVA